VRNGIGARTSCADCRSLSVKNITMRDGSAGCVDCAIEVER
jgi:hypothetical protein